jgi:eukaryotic-like serine/threonine-protein kinase
VERAYLEAIDYTRNSPEQRVVKLQALIDLYQNPGETSAATGECVTLARRRLDELKKDIEKQAPEQLEIIQKRMDEADKLLSTDPKRAQAMYRAVVELYGDKPWAAESVRQAQATINQFSPDTHPGRLEVDKND